MAKDCNWCQIAIRWYFWVVNPPGCSLSVSMDWPVVIDSSCDAPLFSNICNVSDIVWPIVEAINAQVDYEYKNSPMLCLDGTWQYTSEIYANGVLTNSTTVDTGVSCDEPAPIDPQVVKIPYCDVAWTKTMHIKTCLFVFDPENPTQPQEVLLSDSDTNEKCAEDVVEIEFDVECNEDTDTWNYYTLTTINSVALPVSIVDSWVPCDEDKPDYEQVTICDLLTNTQHLITNAIVDWVVTAVSDVDLLTWCNPSSDILVDCDSNTSTVTVDSRVSIVWSETVLPVRIVESCEDSVEIKFDVECNDVTWNYDYITTTITNGVAWATTVVDSGVACTEEKPDYEQISYCNLTTWTTFVITNSIVGWVVTELSNLDTTVSCVPSTVEVDVEYICNSDTNLRDLYLTTITDWVAWAAVITPTTVSCDEDKPDYEQVKVCDPTTDTYHVITSQINPDNTIVQIDDVDTLEECCKGVPKCVESQEWTYGLDNTGTTYQDTATYVMTLSDGSELTIEQTPTGWWTAQNQLLTTLWQAAADAAGLAWFIEPRTVNNIIPSDISGNYWNTPTGLPGAPSEVVAKFLIDNGIVARYLNIQICPGNPVPVNVVRTESAIYNNNPFTLTTAWALLWPKQKFVLCQCCGKDAVWYLSDGVTVASAGQIPKCREPCWTLSLTPAPADRACEFFYDIACDNVNDTDDTNWINLVTRRATVCGWEQISVDYFVEDPLDASALVPYTLVWDFVDCDTWEPIDLPAIDWVVTDCSWEAKAESFDTDVRLVGSKNPIEVFSSCDIIDYYEIELEDGLDWLRNREWHDTAPVSSTSAPNQTQIGRNNRDAHDFSLPTTTDTVQNNFDLNDTNNTAVELDIQVKEWYVIATETMQLKYSWASEWYRAVELWYCCGELEDVAENGWFFAWREMLFTIPKGIHKIRLWNIDSWGSNSDANLSYTLDWGITWISNNTPPNLILTQTKPEQVCKKWYICCGEYFEIDKETPLVIEWLISLCPLECISASQPEPTYQSISEIEVCADGEPAIKRTKINSLWLEEVTFQWQDGVEITPSWRTAWSCTKTSECIKWRNKYLGIDNTGTQFNLDEVIEVRDSDWNVVWSFLVTASADNTEQLNKWIVWLQALYPNALIEQRYAPTGWAWLPAPSSDAPFTTMAARFVQFTACDWDDLPAELFIIERNSNPVNVQMATEQLFAEEQRGYICYECGQEPVLFYSDWTAIPESDIPPCYISCSEPFFEESDACLENDVELTTQTWSNTNVPAWAKSVTINNISGTTTINGWFQLGTWRRVDSISFWTDRGNCVNEVLPAYTLAGWTRQWIAQF